MAHYRNFAQCIEQLLKEHKLTIGVLGAQIGARSDLRRALTNDLSSARRASLCEKICMSGPFSAEECEELRESLEVSRVGLERYASRRSIDRLMSIQTDEPPEPCCISGGPLIQRRLTPLLDADEINILCINCIYSSIIFALQPFFVDKGRSVRMYHYIQPDIVGLNAAEFVACISPILFDTRYSPYLLASWCDTGEYPSINGNLLVINARFGKRTEEQLYVVSDSRSAHELPNADAVGIFAFFSRIIADLPFRPTPLKMFEQASTDYASLVMSYLSRELNRSVFVYGTDISFVQVPTDIAVKAFQDKAMFPPDVMASFLKRLIPLHERRFQNLYTKKKPSVMTFTLEGCQRFMESGKSRDHFAGIRPFLPMERLHILSTMLKYADENRNFSPIVLKDEKFYSRYLTVGYDRLGVGITEYDTDYDLSAGYDYVFLSYPEFTSQYTDYFKTAVLKERCHSREESMRLLHEMYNAYVQKLSQTP